MTRHNAAWRVSDVALCRRSVGQLNVRYSGDGGVALLPCRPRGHTAAPAPPAAAPPRQALVLIPVPVSGESENKPGETAAIFADSKQIPRGSPHTGAGAAALLYQLDHPTRLAASKKC